jgi:hypothetical protein
MKVLLVIVKYPWWAVPFALLSMALFRLPLWLNKNVSFWRLMGSGRNGSFDIRPDLRQWAILMVSAQPGGFPVEDANRNDRHTPTPSIFINNWIKIFKGKTIAYLLEPIEGHGLWESKNVFGELQRNTDYNGKIAVLTRATIRIGQLYKFWKNVPAVASHVKNVKGLITSYGIGEIPFIKQATFSVWESKEAMKIFAYNLPQHKTVISKTHLEKWYKEQMFVRFRILQISESTL